MTYNAGGNIQAADYNTFATSVSGMNELIADTNSGATLLPAAGLGYGQTPLTSVSAASSITAAQWNSLFTTMRSSGTHQGTVVVPPIPASGPTTTPVPPHLGNPVVAVTNSATMSGLITTLKTNKFNLAVGQTTTVVGTGFSNPAPWTTSLIYTFQVDFGTWNNARYFFNTGSSVSITATYSPAPTPDEVAWATLFTDDFPVNFNWQRTTQPSGNLIVNPPGFYLNAPYAGLTIAYQSIYQKYAGGGAGPYYATNYALIEAKLTNAAGTDGKIDYRITLIDGDTFPVVKAASRVTYTINQIQSSGVIPYPGGYTFTSGGFVGV